MNKNENRFYVYEWYNVDTGEVFYVGKGSGSRYKTVTGRNKYFQRYYVKYSCDVRIVKKNMEEDDSYDYEIKLIAYYKEIGQCFCNFDKGGRGGETNSTAPEDTAKLKTVNGYIRVSRYNDDRINSFCSMSEKKELSLLYAMEEFDMTFISEYYDLSRDEKIEFCDVVLERLEELEYDDFIEKLVEDGAYFSEDDFWEHLYKY